jgi:hypothetical protein
MAETPPPRAAPAPAPTVLSGCQMKDTPETRELVAAAGRMLAAAPVSEEEGSKGRDGHDADVEAVIRDLASGKPLTCSVCLADNAKCVGAYEDPRDLRFACSGCCGHGNEDGWCVPLPAPAPPPSTGDGEPLWHLAAPGLRATCGSAAMNEVITTEAGEVTCPACRSASPSPRAQTDEGRRCAIVTEPILGCPKCHRTWEVCEGVADRLATATAALRREERDA